MYDTLAYKEYNRACTMTLAIYIISSSPSHPPPPPRHNINLQPKLIQLGTLYNGGNMVYNIPLLDAGTLYYVRVAAISPIGTSESTLAGNSPVAPSQHPGAPDDIAAEAIFDGGEELNSEIKVGHNILLYTIQDF